MQKVAKFSKVSQQQFEKDYIDTFGCSHEVADKVYQSIKEWKEVVSFRKVLFKWKVILYVWDVSSCLWAFQNSVIQNYYAFP